MMSCVRPARVSLVVLAVAVSIAAGAVLVFRLVTPDTVSRLATHELVALLGLLFLPILTAWAFLADRRAARHAAEALEAASVPSRRAMGFPEQGAAWGRAEQDEDESGQRSVRSWAFSGGAMGQNGMAEEAERELPGRCTETRGARRRHAAARREAGLEPGRGEDAPLGSTGSRLAAESLTAAG